MDFEKKPQSKAFYFFDKLFRTFLCNILCVASMAIPVALYILLLIFASFVNIFLKKEK